MDKHQKKQFKRYISWGLIVLLVLLLAVMPLLAENQAIEDGPQASILHTSLQQHSIDTRIIGGGQLASKGTEAVTIPEAVKLTKYLVGNGDTVRKGDAIARVDKVSVMLALTEVQETLDYLSGQIADAASGKESSKLTTQAAGTVKIVHAKAGDNIRDVMLEHGALAVLSLDNKMAVSVSCSSDLYYGSSVQVTLSSGKKVKGFVESNMNGTLTATIPDKDYSVGTSVTVSTEDGQELGTGELYIHNPWNATAYYGTIKKVSVKVGDKVSAGKELFQLSVGNHSENFRILTSQRQEYEELMQELFQMYSTGVLSAPCDGYVTGVDKEGTFLLAADAGEQSWFIQPLSNTVKDSGWTVSLLSATDSEAPPADGKIPGGETPPGGSEGGTGEGEGTTPTEDIYVVTYVDTANGCVYLQKLNSQDAPITYPALVYPGTETAIKVGDQVKFVDGQLQSNSNSSAGGQRPGGMGGFGGMGSFGGGGGGTVQTFEPYSLETVTVASVTSREEMTLEISVDEQDIARLSMGQEATITVEALTGQSFPATVTSISNTGTNEGGSSKFTVRLTLSSTGDMLPGMNASAYLLLQNQSVAAIPVAALVEETSGTVVYTGYDEKEETLINPVAVTTGVSDGEYVQILSGLSETDTVYYAYYDTPEVSAVPQPGFGFQ